MTFDTEQRADANNRYSVEMTKSEILMLRYMLREWVSYCSRNEISVSSEENDLLFDISLISNVLLRKEKVEND